MPPSARYRPPTSVPDPSSPLFRPWLLAQLREIAQDHAALSLSDPPTAITLERIEVPAGAQRRVQPTASGMVAVLEAPSSSNAGQAVTFFIENPAGALTVVASPHVAADGKVTRTKINGGRKATYTLAGVVQLFSNGQDSWNAFAETPEETPLLVSRMGPTGPAGPPGTSSALRRIRRHVFYTDGTCDIIENGATTNVALTSFGLAADGQRYRAWIVASGNGGSRSFKEAAASATDRIGGAGNGGPAVAVGEWGRGELEEYIAFLGTDIPVTVGAAGAGAAAGTINTSNETVAAGTPGALSAFGDLLVAYPGGRGNVLAINSTCIGGGGGGWLGAGADAGAGGGPHYLITSNTRAGYCSGGTGGLSLTETAAASIYGGGGGGFSPAGGGAGTDGGRSWYGVPGSGCGGSIDATGPTARDGTDAGRRGAFTDGVAGSAREPVGGGPAGGTGATGHTGNDGADGDDGILGLFPGESGAGGGALICNASGGTQLSGRGGDGGFPGGSGAPSGCTFTDSDAPVACASARGGNGADGVVVVDTLG